MSDKCDSAVGSKNGMKATVFRYKLKFNVEGELKDSVLKKLEPDILSIMGDKNVNLRILTQLNALLVFESNAMDPIMNYQYKTESERIHDLFGLMKLLDDDSILQCLQQLCDLKDMSITSTRIRKLLQELYPNSVHENKENK